MGCDDPSLCGTMVCPNGRGDGDDMGTMGVDGGGIWPNDPLFSPSKPTSLVLIRSVQIFIPS